MIHTSHIHVRAGHDLWITEEVQESDGELAAHTERVVWLLQNQNASQYRLRLKEVKTMFRGASNAYSNEGYLAENVPDGHLEALKDDIVLHLSDKGREQEIIVPEFDTEFTAGGQPVEA